MIHICEVSLANLMFSPTARAQVLIYVRVTCSAIMTAAPCDISSICGPSPRPFIDVLCPPTLPLTCPLPFLFPGLLHELRTPVHHHTSLKVHWTTNSLTAVCCGKRSPDSTLCGLVCAPCHDFLKFGQLNT